MPFLRAMLQAARRRGGLLAIAVLACSLGVPAAPALAQAAQAWRADHWVASWGAAPAGPPLDSATTVYNNQTLRLIVHTSTAGSRVRIRLSNEMGSSPVRVGAAHVALRSGGASLVGGSDRALTFGGAASIVLPPGSAVLSDPAILAVPALADLAVSLYLPGQYRVTTLHPMATQNSYVSGAGNFVASSPFPILRSIEQWPLLTEVDVIPAAGSSGAAIALGDSITDGLRSTGNSNNRWPDWLARRLQAAGADNARIGVVNRGIAGNNLLSNLQVGSLGGRSTLERFDRDVVATAGASTLFVLIGINDIINGSTSLPVSADSLIAGYRQLIARAHAKGIAVVGCTMPPFEGAGYYSAAKDLVRQGANNWIRSSGEFDAVIDFEQLLRDPANPRRLNPLYDSGDHLHPNNAGYQLMGNAVPLGLFSASAQ